MYNKLNDYYKTKYGEKIYKLSFSLGTTCPNRDGKISTKGCIFCSNQGSGDFATKININNIDEAINEQINLISDKFKGNKFIAYFQSNTNTYGNLDYLFYIYNKLANKDNIVAIDIATRPDCIDDDVIKRIQELVNIKDVYIELGFQTSNEKTATLINRGYTNDVFINACNKLNSIGVFVIAHQIIGLPNENLDDMINTTKLISQLQIHGIKYHVLSILKGTKLEKLYNNGNYSPITLDEYTNYLLKCIEYLDKDIIIHRFTGDPPKILNIAPKWTENKKTVLNHLNKILENEVTQGIKWQKS